MVSKLLYKDGVGDPLGSQTFLSEKLGGLHITNFKHNRFNITFKNALGVFYSAKTLLDYIKSTKENPNLLLQAIVQDLENPVHMTFLRALGLVEKAITTPYFNVSENPALRALDMNWYYETMIEKLQEYGKDATQVMHGATIFKTQRDEDDVVLKKLVRESSDDQEVKQLVEKMCVAIHGKAATLFKHHLPGGKFHNPSETLKEEGTSCSTNNINLERLMAQQDRHLRQVLNATQENRASKLMFVYNETLSWLDQKDENRKKEIIIRAQKKMKDLQRTNKIRRRNMKEAVRKMIADKEASKKAKES